MSKHRETLVIAVLVVLALLIWLALMREFRLDDSFITYRYARSVVRGVGLVYNPGDSVLSTTAPLYALLLALLNPTGLSFHTLGGLVGALAIGLGGGAITTLLPDRIPFFIRAWAGLVYVLSSLLWLSLGMETALWLALVLGAVVFAQRERWSLAGALIGLAVLTRPDAAMPGGLIGLWLLAHVLGSKSQRLAALASIVRYGVSAAAPVLIFAIWATATYGSPLPATLGAKAAQAQLGITGFGVFTDTLGGLGLIVSGLFAQSPLYAVVPMLMLVGLLARPQNGTLIVIIWSVLHQVAYVVLDVAPYRWYYTPLLPGVVVLTAFGIGWLYERAVDLPLGRYALLLVMTLPIAAELTSFARIAETFERGSTPQIMLPVVDWAAYRTVGDWLKTNTPADATVGVAEVGQIGFYADRWMTDYLGLLQPDVAAALERGDLYSWLPQFEPDYLAFQRFRGAPLVIYNYRIDNEPWFLANYRPVAEFDDPRYAYGPVTIFKRVTPRGDLISQQAAHDFGRLRLTGLATDGNDLNDTASTVRVRLDWQVVGSLSNNINIAVAALDMPGTPGVDHRYDTANWSGEFSTWHGLVLPEDTPPGGYPVLVTVSPASGNTEVISQPVGWFDVSFPKTGDDRSGVGFSDGDRSQLRLVDQAAEPNSETLQLELVWWAAQDLTTDYHYFVHVTAPGGELLAQADGQPLDGRYPTFLWQSGERVPLNISVPDLPTEPGRYEVYAGWYNPVTGVRLTHEDGTDALRLYQLVVGLDGSAIIAPAE